MSWQQRARERAADEVATCWEVLIPISEKRKYRNEFKTRRLTSGRTHGLASTYNVGCRCEACRATASARRAAYRVAMRP